MHFKGPLIAIALLTTVPSHATQRGAGTCESDFLPTTPAPNPREFYEQVLEFPTRSGQPKMSELRSRISNMARHLSDQQKQDLVQATLVLHGKNTVPDYVFIKSLIEALPSLNVTSQSARTGILLNAIDAAGITMVTSNTSGILEAIRNLDIYDERLRQAILQRMIEIDPIPNPNLLAELPTLLQSENLRHELAEFHLQLRADTVISNIRAFKLSEAHRIEIAKIAARQNFSGLSIHIGSFEITDHEARVAIAKVDAAHDPRFASSLTNYDLTSYDGNPDLIRELLETSIRHSIRNALTFFERLNYVRAVLAASSYANNHSRQIYENLKQVALEVLPEETLAGLLMGGRHYAPNFEQVIPENFDAIEFESKNNIKPSLTHHFRAMALKHHLLPEPYVDAIWDRIRKKEVAATLFAVILKLRYVQKIPLKDIPPDSIEYLRLYTGLSTEHADALKHLSTNTLGTVFELILEIQSHLKTKLFGESQLPQKAFERVHLKTTIDMLTKMRDLFLLRNSFKKEQATNTWSNILALISSNDGGAESGLKNLENAILNEVRSQFTSGDSHALDEITYEQFESLKEKWGTLEPIYTLLSRFQGESRWEIELPILKRVFRATLENRFLEYKFRGAPEDQTDQIQATAQLAPLNLQQKKSWEKIRSTIRLWSVNDNNANDTKINEASALIALNEFFATNLIPHISGLLAERPTPELPNALEQLKNIKTVSEAGSVLHLLEILHRRHQYTEQIEQDIRHGQGMIKGFKKIFSQKSNETILFTTTINDPKLLLTIGDLVQTSSCQNYRTGSLIQTLLGYVIDANVQAVASFAVSPGDFSNAKDFLMVRDALRERESEPKIHSNPKIMYQFYASQKVLRFMIRNENGTQHEIHTKPLAYAYHRQIIKLGQTTNFRPGIRLERPYIQPHPAGIAMQSDVNSIIETLRLDLGAEPNANGPIKIPKSRNPGGVYSDAAQGVKTAEYEIR